MSLRRLRQHARGMQRPARRERFQIRRCWPRECARRARSARARSAAAAATPHGWPPARDSTSTLRTPNCFDEAQRLLARAGADRRACRSPTPRRTRCPTRSASSASSARADSRPRCCRSDSARRIPYTAAIAAFAWSWRTQAPATPTTVSPRRSFSWDRTSRERRPPRVQSTTDLALARTDQVHVDLRELLRRSSGRRTSARRGRTAPARAPTSTWLRASVSISISALMPGPSSSVGSSIASRTRSGGPMAAPSCCRSFLTRAVILLPGTPATRMRAVCPTAKWPRSSSASRAVSLPVPQIQHLRDRHAGPDRIADLEDRQLHAPHEEPAVLVLLDGDVAVARRLQHHGLDRSARRLDLDLRLADSRLLDRDPRLARGLATRQIRLELLAARRGRRSWPDRFVAPRSLPAAGCGGFRAPRASDRFRPLATRSAPLPP